MKVCLFVEGAYPYISGGVSSWINQLTKEMDDISFIIVSIMPSSKENNKYKYKINNNIEEIKTIYLDDYLNLDPLVKPKEPKLTQIEKNEIEKFFNFDKETNLEILLNIVNDKEKFGTSVEFFRSKFFWDLCVKIYNEKYNEEEFNSFFWTVRSMFLIFVNVVQSEIPEADIYHSVSTGYAGILGVLSKTKFKKPLILTEHGIYAREREEEIIKAKWVTGVYKKFWINLFYLLAIGTYKKADKVISLFEKNKKIQLELGSSNEGTVVIPNGVDIEKFSTKKIETETFNIGAILRIVPIKDVKTLIRSFKLVKDDVKEAKLYLIGPYDEDKKYYNECLNLIDNFKLKDDIIITGNTDLMEYMKILDVLALTSISEGQPLVILEGMASSIPFVATDVGGCKELLEGKQNENIGNSGIITPPVSPFLTYKAIMELYKNKDLRKNMGQNGRKRVEKYYTKQLFIDRYRNMYKELRCKDGRNRIHVTEVI